MQAIARYKRPEVKVFIIVLKELGIYKSWQLMDLILVDSGYQYA